MTFFRQPLPPATVEKFHENGMAVPEFAIGVDIVESILTGTAESITAEILEEYAVTLSRQYLEFVAEATMKAMGGTSKSAESTKQVLNRDSKRRPNALAPVLSAQFRGPSEADLKQNAVIAKRVGTLDTTDLTANEKMVQYADRLVTSIANNDHSAVQQCKVGLASSSKHGLSIAPSDVVGPVASCATDGIGAKGRIYTLAPESDDENDGSNSLANSSDLGVRPRSPGRKSCTKEDVEAESEDIVKTSIAALNDGYGEDILAPDIFKTEVAKVNGRDCHIIRVSPEVYVKLRERSVANKRIRDAVVKALRLLLEKRGALDPVSRSKLQAILTEHERIDRMSANDQASFMCALPIIDEDPSILGVAFSQISPGLNVGVNIIEQIHDILFDHENAQGIQTACRFAADQVVVKMKSDGTYDPLRTAWNKILTSVQRLSKRSPLGLPWELYGFKVDDNGMPQLLSNDNLAKMFIVHITLKLSRQPGYQRLQEKYTPTSLTAELVATLGVKELTELIGFAEKEVECELPRTQKSQRQAEITASQSKPVYNNLGSGAAFVATAEQASLVSQRKVTQGPSPEFRADYDYWVSIGEQALKSGKSSVQATIAVATALNEHCGHTLLSSISPAGLILAPGTTWKDNNYFDRKTTAGVRYLKDTIGITTKPYFSMLPSKPGLQRTRNALQNSTLQLNTCKAAAAPRAVAQQGNGSTAGKGTMGKGAPMWKGNGRGNAKATAAAAMTHGSSGSDGYGGGYGGGSSGNACEAI